MLLANNGVFDSGLRVGILAALITVFVSSPPRALYFRIFLGATSTIVLIASFVLMADYHIGILDALLYLLVSIVLALEALEYETAPTYKRAKRVMDLPENTSSTQSA